MNRSNLPGNACVLIAILSLLCCLHAQATITVLHDWRLGESDPANAADAALTTQDYVGGTPLVFQGNSSYSSDVGFAAAARSGSSLSVNFTNNAFASNSVVSTLNNNFGIEAWVKPQSSADGVILYNGKTDTSGWGFTLATNLGVQRYGVLYGGVDVMGSYTATNGVWTHLALVCSNGISTFYVNGILVSTRTLTPNVPTGNFALACAPQVVGTQAFTGLIDEVRVFTFSPNNFNVSDLLLNAPIEKVDLLPATQITASNSVLRSAVNPGGVATAGWFEWGLSVGYGNSNAPISAGNGTVPVAVSNQISGLLPGHTYHFRAVATNSSGIFRSWDQTFVTPIINPTSQVVYAHVPFASFSVPLSATPQSLSANDGANGMVLRADGTVALWGDNSANQTNFAAGLNNIIGIAAGNYHFLALKRDGTVVAWGTNNVGQTNVPIGLDNVVSVAAGGSQSMAVRRDGSVVSWGNDPSLPGPLANIIQLSASLNASMGLDNSGNVIFNGPVPTGATNIVSVASGAYNFMALRADGQLFVWGFNNVGQTNIPAFASLPIAIASAGDGCIALLQDGSVKAWGSNDGSKNTVPPSVTNAVAVAAAGGANFALRADGVTIGWGDPNKGQTSVTPGLTNIMGRVIASGANTNSPGTYPVTFLNRNYLGAMNSTTGSVTVVAPSLTVTPGIAGTATLSWPSNAAGYTLEQNTLIQSNGWTAAASGLTNPVIIPTTNAALFYRLTHP